LVENHPYLERKTDDLFYSNQCALAGDINTDEELRRALAAIQAQDNGDLGSLGELLATHPTIAKRLDMLRK